MVPVAADFVSRSGDLADQVRITRRNVAQYKERRVGSGGGQQVRCQVFVVGVAAGKTLAQGDDDR